MWHPEPQALKNMRQEIDYNWEEFESIVQAKPFKKKFGGLYMGADEQLSTMPKGYEKNHPGAGYLKLKSFIAEQSFSDDELSKSTLHRKTVQAFQTIQPFLDFINRTIEEV